MRDRPTCQSYDMASHQGKSHKYAMLFRELLTEMLWEDRFEAARVARKYPNSWIHFAGRPAYTASDPQPVYKMGVNPSQGHHDPPGIYFYPVKWLFSDAASLSQYATEYKYYYIVNFKRSAKIINLGRMTMAQVTQIATQNGWIDQLREVMTHPELLKNNRQPMAAKLLKRAGGIFYATMDYLVNVKGQRWLALMRGYDGLIDPGHGIISGNEVAQAVVFARQNVDILAHGENVDRGDREYANILKQIAEEQNGRFYYKNKLPSADFPNDGKPFRIVLKLGWYKIETSYYKDGFWFVREEKYDTYSGDRNSHYRNILYYVTRTAKEAEPAGQPMFWTGERVNELLYAIRPTTKFYQRVDDDGLHAWESPESGIVHAMLRVIVDRDDRITIDAEIGFNNNEIKVAQQFEQKSVEEIANMVLNDLAQQLIQTVPNPTALKKVKNGLAGFNFGNRFDTVGQEPM